MRSSKDIWLCGVARRVAIRGVKDRLFNIIMNYWTKERIRWEMPVWRCDIRETRSPAVHDAFATWRMHNFLLGIDLSPGTSFHVCGRLCRLDIRRTWDSLCLSIRFFSFVLFFYSTMRKNHLVIGALLNIAHNIYTSCFTCMLRGAFCCCCCYHYH